MQGGQNVLNVLSDGLNGRYCGAICKFFWCGSTQSFPLGGKYPEGGIEGTQANYIALVPFLMVQYPLSPRKLGTFPQGEGFRSEGNPTLNSYLSNR